MQKHVSGPMPATEAASDRPLVVDIADLMATSWRDERWLALLRGSPSAVLGAFRGRLEVAVDRADSSLQEEVAHWPVRAAAAESLAAQARCGRSIVLVTSAPPGIAAAVSARFAFIGEVVADAPAGDGERESFLASRFPGGFERTATAATASAASPATAATPTAGFDAAWLASLTLAQWRALIAPVRRTLRLHQWAKNLLVFVPLVLGGKLGEPAAWLSALVGFLALGLVASATYIINDLIDLPSDRQHWTKRERPLAGGSLSIRSAGLIALVLLAVGLALAATQTRFAVALVLAYVVTTLAYSSCFKRMPIADVFVLASLFTLRLGLGIALTDVRLSPWLLVFSMFIFLSLSVAKRHTEILRMIEMKRASTPGRGYRAEDAPLTLALGLASAMAAVLIMVVYLVEDAVPRQIYAMPQFLWTIPPILFLFLGRIWLLSQRGTLNDDPVAFALKDPVSLGYGAAMVAALVLALTGAGLS